MAYITRGFYLFTDGKMYARVVVGGTFNRLHKGHKQILQAAFEIGRSVVIGLTSDEFASRFRVLETKPYRQREKQINDYIKQQGKGKPCTIIQIDDSYGITTLDPEIDCIVVSEETLLRAEEINAIRFKKELSRISIHVIPIVLADDRKPISGERISRGEINEDGRVIVK
ncbi:MAG: phosphopantetheine adenylyltransferase [Candidatus Altiarchaeales archaeon ex4484_96]|nr:MAG: phosphopantetheine adenylyltransferase [Candidatus Altiarchaeales archaeon ex4484_96]